MSSDCEIKCTSHNTYSELVPPTFRPSLGVCAVAVHATPHRRAKRRRRPLLRRRLAVVLFSALAGSITHTLDAGTAWNQKQTAPFQLDASDEQIKASLVSRQFETARLRTRT